MISSQPAWEQPCKGGVRAINPGVDRARPSKLIEIDDKYRFLKHGIAVVDLGAAPGGWSQIAAKRVGAAKARQGGGDRPRGDAGIPGVNLPARLPADDAPEKLIAMMGGRADVVMSDMAPNTTGHRKTDQLRIVGLIETAAAFACDVLNPWRNISGQGLSERRRCRTGRGIQRDFASVRHVLPASSRQIH